MGKSHIKRLAAPKTWPISRKSSMWVSRPTTGTHKLNMCVALDVLIKEILKICKTTKELKYALAKEQIKVDGVLRKDKNFPVGIMDVVQVKDKFYRILFNTNGKIMAIPIKKEESKIKPKKIINKTSLKGKKLQINLYDGSNLNDYKNKVNTYDTLLFEENKINKKISFEEGAFVYITGGSQIGKSGILKKIEKSKDFQPKKIIFNDGTNDFETLKDHAFVIGKSKPLISLSDE